MTCGQTTPRWPRQRRRMSGVSWTGCRCSGRPSRLSTSASPTFGGVHNKISDSISKAPVGAPDGIERVLRNLRGYASYAYSRTVLSVKGDIRPEMIEDPALDEMWEAAVKDSNNQLVAKLITDKPLRKMMLSMSKHPVKEYLKNGLEMLLYLSGGEANCSNVVIKL